MYYVYILKLKDDSIYIGCTSDIKERLKKHNTKQVAATKNKIPAKLITTILLPNKYTAFNFEKYLKTGSGRAFIKRHFI